MIAPRGQGVSRYPSIIPYKCFDQNIPKHVDLGTPPCRASTQAGLRALLSRGLRGCLEGGLQQASAAARDGEIRGRARFFAVRGVFGCIKGYERLVIM